VVMVGSWPPKNGVQNYTITGTKEEIYKILDEVRENGGKFAATPNICRVVGNQWHVLLKLNLHVEVGSSDSNY
jgi:hypothetical protein